MNEPRRWREDGASPDEMQALDAARELKMSPASRARIVGALGLGATTLAAASASAAGTSAAATGLGIVAKIAGGLIVAVIGVGAIWVIAERSSSPTHAPIETTRSAIEGSGSVASTPTSESAPPNATEDQPASAPSDSASTALDTPPAIPSTQRTRVAPAPSGTASLSDEVAALDRVRKALASDAPDAALGELAKYGKRFPQGTLAAEQTVLRVQALLAGGRNAEAVALADSFAAAHPESPYSRRVEQMVADVRKKK